MFVQVIHQELKEFEEYLLDGSKNSRKMITEIFNCLHLLCFQPFFKANPAALHEASWLFQCQLCSLQTPCNSCAFTWLHTLPPGTQVTLCVCRKQTRAGESSAAASPELSCALRLGAAPAPGCTRGERVWCYVRGQQVWHHTSISSDARDCDLEQGTSPAVKVQTSLCKEELGCFNPFRNKGVHAFKYWINHYLRLLFSLPHMDALS